MLRLAAINASLGLLPWHCRLRAEMGVSQATQICLAATHVSTHYKVIAVCLLFPMASSCSLAATEDRCTWCLLNLGSWCQQPEASWTCNPTFDSQQHCPMLIHHPVEKSKQKRSLFWSIHWMPYGSTARCCLVWPAWVCQQTQVNDSMNQGSTETWQGDLDASRGSSGGESSGKAVLKWQ